MTDGEQRGRAGGRRVRIAAVADLHFEGNHKGSLVEVFAEASRKADILALCGDLTTHGHPDQMRAFVEELTGVEIPMLAVLGNHDYEGEEVAELAAILADRGVRVLDGDNTVVEGIGFAGIKGFAGGFGRGSLAPFGERLIKNFVQAALDDALRLENALRTLATDQRVVLMHYSPTIETLKGEPEMIYPFLGSSRFLEPIETYGATAVFHGHAHHGVPEARTPSGVPVYNVAWPLLREKSGALRVHTVQAPERRRQPAESEHAG